VDTSRTGHKERRIAAENEARAIWLPPQPAMRWNRPALTAIELDLIIVATVTPDCFSLPRPACAEEAGSEECRLLRHQRGLLRFLYALQTARHYLNGGPRKRLW